ncbi:MAG: class II fructose-bisphosphate aldolase [Candidatus Magasanikbacteria bacterium]
MANLKQKIKEVDSNKAIPHFNISNFEMMKAIDRVANKFEAPIFVGTSEGERGFLGENIAVSLVNEFSKKLQDKTQLFLNADHTYSLDLVKKAARAGYDSVIYDGADLPFEENVEKTREAVNLAKDINSEIVVEGELGYIGKSSTLREEVPEKAEIKKDNLPEPKEAHDFVKKTGVDMFAPAVGNLHGMFSNRSNPSLKIERIQEIREAVDTPLVLHGGSGVKPEDFRRAIKAGIDIVHVSTEIRISWKKTLKTKINESEKIAPYKIFPEVIEAMEEVMSKKMELFGW